MPVELVLTVLLALSPGCITMLLFSFPGFQQNLVLTGILDIVTLSSVFSLLTCLSILLDFEVLQNKELNIVSSISP